MAGGKNIFNPKPPLLSIKSRKENIMAYLYQSPYLTLTMTNAKTELFLWVWVAQKMPPPGGLSSPPGPPCSCEGAAAPSRSPR